MANPNSMDSEVLDDKNWEQVELASLSQRVGDFLLDMIFLSVLLSLIELVLGHLGYSQFVTDEHASFSFGLAAVPKIVTIERVLVVAIYYIVQEWLTGRTLGKLIMGTQAINGDGKDLTLFRAIARTICRFIPLEFVSFLFPHEDGTRGWHDRIPKTLVINLRRIEKPSPTTWQS